MNNRINEIRKQIRALRVSMLEAEAVMREQEQMAPDAKARIEFLLNPQAFSGFLPLLVMMLIFGGFAIAALQVVFRTSYLRAAVIVILSGAALFPAFFFLQPIFSMLLGSPFLLLMLFLTGVKQMDIKCCGFPETRSRTSHFAMYHSDIENVYTKLQQNHIKS